MLDTTQFDAVTKLFEDYAAHAAEFIDGADIFERWEERPQHVWAGAVADGLLQYGAARDLKPDVIAMNAHIHELCDPAFTHGLPNAVLEIAYGHPVTDGGDVNQAQTWSALNDRELRLAAESAAALNAKGANLYIGGALRQYGSRTVPPDRRAKVENYLASRFAWVDFDKAGDAERIEAVLKQYRLVPALIVTTGTVPHLRGQLYFFVTGIKNADHLKEVNSALQRLLGADAAVVSAHQPLRLAGSVSYPTEKKAARGYVPELTTLKKIDNAPTYQADYLISLAGPNNEVASNTKQNPQRDKRSISSGDAFADYANDHALEADPELIAAALEHIPNDDFHWDEWKRAAMAAWRATRGSEVAFEAFDKWSRKSSKYDAQETRRQWNKIFRSPPTNIGAGTIFKMALDNGWVWPPAERAEDQADGDCTDSDAEATTPPPGMGHNSKKGKQPLHIIVANIFIAGMQKGLGQLLRRVPDLKGVEHIYRYRDGLWSLQADKDVSRSLHPQLQQIVNDLGRENKSKVSTFNEATAHILRSAEVCNHEPVTFDAHGKVPTRDALIDPITGQMETFKPEHFATWCLPIRYDANAVCPHWEQLLNDAFADMIDGDRKITVELVQELIGMALIDDKPKSLSRALVLFGFPDTGKTVILKVFTALFGGAITTTFAKLEGNHGLQSFARRLPWVLGEAFNQSGWYVSDLVKCIITGDPVEVNPKNVPAISMKVNTPAFWGTNHPPKFKESSGSMATRMIIIPMTRTFCKETPVGVAEEARKHNPAWEPHDLVINTELPGVLNWALIGLQRALQRGHFVNTESGKDLLEQSRKDSNCAAAFVDECLDADAEVMMSTIDVYATFKQWWISEHGDRAVVPSPTTFGHDLANLPNSRIAQDKKKFKNKASQRFYLGCKLNVAGIGFWEDAAFIARVSGSIDHRMAETVEKTIREIPPTWKATEVYRRVVPNIQRFLRDAVLQAASSDEADVATTRVKADRKQYAPTIDELTSRPYAPKEFPWD